MQLPHAGISIFGAAKHLKLPFDKYFFMPIIFLNKGKLHDAWSMKQARLIGEVQEINVTNSLTSGLTLP